MNAIGKMAMRAAKSGHKTGTRMTGKVKTKW